MEIVIFSRQRNYGFFFISKFLFILFSFSTMNLYLLPYNSRKVKPYLWQAN